MERKPDARRPCLLATLKHRSACCAWLQPERASLLLKPFPVFPCLLQTLRRWEVTRWHRHVMGTFHSQTHVETREEVLEPVTCKPE